MWKDVVHDAAVHFAQIVLYRAWYKSLCLALQKQVDAELLFNAKEMERLTGTHPVRYGDSIQVRHSSPLSFPALPLLFSYICCITIFSPLLQLQHILTKKYVTVNETLTSRTENTSLRVELCDSRNRSSDSIFKILPRYKVRSVGDEVRGTHNKV